MCYGALLSNNEGRQLYARQPPDAMAYKMFLNTVERVIVLMQQEKMGHMGGLLTIPGFILI